MNLRKINAGMLLQMIRGRFTLHKGVVLSPMNDKRKQHLEELAGKLHKKMCGRLRILEIGCLHGETTAMLARYGNVTCVDTWEFGMDKFFKNTKGCSVIAIKGSSDYVLPMLKEGIFDLIVLDGDHRWPRVYNDLLQSLRILDVGGTICGDDLEKQFTSSQEFIDAINASYQDYDYENRYHAGVSSAVYAVFGRVDERDGFWSFTCGAK